MAETDFDIGPILEHLGAKLPYSRRAGWQQMRCFLHEDKHPSGSVNFDINRFWCWSCGINEDGVGLLQHVEHLDFLSAVEEAQRVSQASDGKVRTSSRGWRTLFGG